MADGLHIYRKWSIVPQSNDILQGANRSHIFQILVVRVPAPVVRHGQLARSGKCHAIIQGLTDNLISFVVHW